jgi:hypothetical protein
VSPAAFSISWEKRMRTTTKVAAVLALFLAGTSGAADKPAAENPLTALERFAGEWVVDGKWSNGDPLHARGVYEWGLGKKILKARTFVGTGDREYQRYESILAWHPEKKSLFEISFAYDGAVTEVLVESVDKDTLRIGWTPYTAGKPSRARQVIKFLDNDHFRWTVQLQDGDDWKQLIEATWQRKEK